MQTNRFTPKQLSRDKIPVSSGSDSGGRARDPVHVCCRLRPLQEDKESNCVKLISPTTLTVLASEGKIIRKSVNYVFNHIFTSYSTQGEVFQHVAFPLLQNLLVGKNGLLFTYGVTGSGKTFTLTGDQNNSGIMPRAINMLFNTIGDYQADKYVIKSDRMNGFEVQSDIDARDDRLLETKSSSRRLKSLKRTDSKPFYENDGSKITGVNENSLYSVFISYIEIYNNTVFDLLDESPPGKSLQSKILREDSQKHMYVNGVIEVEVKTAAEAFDVLFIGQKKKRMAHTTLNAESSRSHSIFNIRLVQLEQNTRGENGQLLIPDRNLIKVGQLSLVDLAGSERCSRTHNTGLRLKEASSINNSLMSLRTCLEILRENQLTGSSKLVPYRDSRLTHLFKNYFEGEGQVRMIVCINPSVQDYEENLQVLKFAEMTQDVKVTRPESRYTPYRKTPNLAKSNHTPVIRKTPRTLPLVGASIPSVKLDFEGTENCKMTIQLLIKHMKQKTEKRKLFAKEREGKDMHFRKRLMDMSNDIVVTKTDLENVRTLFQNEKRRARGLEKKLGSLESTNDTLVTENNQLHDAIRNLHNIIDEKDLKINQNFLEREKTKQKQAVKAEKMSLELETKLRRQREHLDAKIQAKHATIQKVKQMLDNEVEIIPMINAPISAETQTQTIHKEGPHLFNHRNAATNPRRRSRSAGEVWLEHNSIKPVALGTVLQPAMKKRKSVTKLSKAGDVTNPKQNRYCLIAQEADTDGEVETKLYKGDILPTCGGGAQVVFNDVERLRQESPTRNGQK